MVEVIWTAIQWITRPDDAAVAPLHPYQLNPVVDTPETVTLDMAPVDEITVANTTGATLNVVVNVTDPETADAVVPASMLYGKCAKALVRSDAFSTLPLVYVTLAVIYSPFHSPSVVCQVVGSIVWLMLTTIKF